MKWYKGRRGYELTKGRKGMQIEELTLRQISAVDYIHITTRYLYSKPAELEAALKDPDTPIFDIVIIRTLLMAAKEGSMREIEYILNRLLGKPKQMVELSHAQQEQARVVIELPDNGRGGG